MTLSNDVIGAAAALYKWRKLAPSQTDDFHLAAPAIIIYLDFLYVGVRPPILRGDEISVRKLKIDANLTCVLLAGC